MLDFLQHRINYERQPPPAQSVGLELSRMRTLLRRLGSPHERLKAVHIAGTKGKGSTSGMAAAILRQAGYRVGLYTSPHLRRLEERFVVDGAACSAQMLADLAEQVRPVVERMDRETNFGDGPTFFEVTTAMAMLYFEQADVEVAVLEVGLGGRLDSTNVCQPEVTAVTSISFDHMRQLGHTLTAIASEKAGIIKPGVTVVSGVRVDEPRRVIANLAAARAAPLKQIGVDFEADYSPPDVTMEPARRRGRIRYRCAGGPFANQELTAALPVVGRHQADNAAVAIAIIEALVDRGWRVPPLTVSQGLESAQIAGRVEVVGCRPTAIIDTAHNPASVAALLQTLRESFPERPRALVFASSRDKQIGEMLRLLLPEFDQVLFTRYHTNPRAATTDELLELALSARADLAPCPTRQMACDDPGQAWQAAREFAAPHGVVCATGSFFLAGELHQWILDGPLTSLEESAPPPTAPLAVP